MRPFSKSLYYLQPDGTWKKGGDGRSEGKTLGELKAMKRAKVRREANIVNAKDLS